MEEENLTEEQIQKLEREYSTIMEVVRRDDRLEEIAKHIVSHFLIVWMFAMMRDNVDL